MVRQVLRVVTHNQQDTAVSWKVVGKGYVVLLREPADEYKQKEAKREVDVAKTLVAIMRTMSLSGESLS
jgi:hypothetical protein